MEWDQNKKKISIKIMLPSVKESIVNYTENSVSFRARLNEEDFGFDLDLFDQIEQEQCYFNTDKRDFIVIYLQKKKEAEWPRLLHTFFKVTNVIFFDFKIKFR